MIGKKTELLLKGLGLIRGFCGLRFSETLKFLTLCGVHSHNKGNMSWLQNLYSNICLQVELFTVAMETPTNKVKMPFF